MSYQTAFAHTTHAMCAWPSYPPGLWVTVGGGWGWRSHGLRSPWGDLYILLGNFMKRIGWSCQSDKHLFDVSLGCRLLPHEVLSSFLRSGGSLPGEVECRHGGDHNHKSKSKTSFLRSFRRRVSEEQRSQESWLVEFLNPCFEMNNKFSIDLNQLLDTTVI